MSAIWAPLSRLAIPHVAHLDGVGGVGAVRLLPLHKALPPHRVADSGEGLPTVTFAVYGEGERRGTEGLLQVTALVFEHTGLPVDEARIVVERLRHQRLAHLAFSTGLWGGEGEDEATFSVVVPLSRPLSPDEHATAWQALHSDLGSHALPRGAVAGRAWAVPWCPRSRFGSVTYELRDGFVADADQLLAPRILSDEPPRPPPEHRIPRRRRRARALRATQPQRAWP